ncbi:MAG: response regulator [Myxococcaceae bacterium]|nr:response regulator [Myxococcaceae bacterium]
MTDQPTVLLVDDDDAFRTRLARALTERGFAVTAFASVEAARAGFSDSPEYAVLDLRMGGASGLELLKVLRERDPSTTVVMLTGYGSIPTAVEATRLGAAAYLTKPTDADAVVQALTGTTASATTQETPTLARAEWEYIHRVLADCDQNISEAARRLGLHRRSLQRKLQKHPPTR